MSGVVVDRARVRQRTLAVGRVAWWVAKSAVTGAALLVAWCVTGIVTLLLFVVTIFPYQLTGDRHTNETMIFGHICSFLGCVWFGSLTDKRAAALELWWSRLTTRAPGERS